MRIYSLRVPVFILAWICFFSPLNVRAEGKQWSGKYDAITWENDFNWFSAAVPSAADDVIIDLEGADVAVNKEISVQSLTVGGRENSTLTFLNFVYGTIAPEDNADTAIYIRKGGNVASQGAGTVTLKGAFKNSEQALPDEPGFMFGAE